MDRFPRKKVKSEVMVKLCELNPHLVCFLCAGYLVNATTIVECLHTFCKSCIVRHLQTSKHCPTCNIQVHETDPLSALKLDRTIQDVIAKLLPRIVTDEITRREKYYNIPKQEKEKVEEVMEFDLIDLKNSFRNDEQINLFFSMSRADNGADIDGDIEEIQNKFVRCSIRSKILHIKQLLSKCYNAPLKRYKIKVSCEGHQLYGSENLKLVYVMYWKRKPQPMVLNYAFEEREEIIVGDMLDEILEKIDTFQIDNKALKIANNCS